MNILDDAFYSTVLEEKRNISVYTISKNRNPDRIKHAVYLLDGNHEFDNMIVNQLKSFISQCPLEGILLVTIANVDRVRDMSPVQTSFCKALGVKLFLKNIEDKIIPPVISKYGKTPFRIIEGQPYINDRLT